MIGGQGPDAPPGFPFVIRFADGAQTTIPARNIREALSICQRRQILKKITTRAEIIAAARADATAPE